MRFFVRTLLIAVLAIAFQLGFGWPWWSVVIAGVIGGLLINGLGIGAFMSGFIAMVAVWGIWAYQIDTTTESILTTKVADIIGVGNPLIIILLTAIVGGLAGGMGALSGWSIGKLRKEKPRSGYYQG
ncbi:MAG TPA: hypothetical protein DCE41_06785 [Cytophagales bacterium]|nr:hypothetical protein [Cytophagales bacterium]HAA19950.1 hypothetical protein [Cytophagales bacterium]HAP62623.1 hypothetical protein [Cytophagales bacterium]